MYLVCISFVSRPGTEIFKIRHSDNCIDFAHEGQFRLPEGFGHGACNVLYWQTCGLQSLLSMEKMHFASVRTADDLQNVRLSPPPCRCATPAHSMSLSTTDAHAKSSFPDDIQKTYKTDTAQTHANSSFTDVIKKR